MEIKVEWSELRKNKLFVAVPMFGGMCFGSHTKSLIDLSTQFALQGIEVRNYFLFNESLIPRARNYAADEFLRSDCTHFLFIDADVSFQAQSVLEMLALQTEASPYDVICGVYPKKVISWEKIKAAVDKGIADEDPNVLENFVGDFVFNFAIEPGKTKQIRLDEPVEVLESGTGFMMIKRSTFDKYREAFPEYSYRPDHVRTQHFDGSREIHAYFLDPICPDSKRHLSEDYFFCQNVRKMGGKVWICPWIRLQHTGMYVFGGDLPAIMSIGQSATAGDLPKNKKVK